MKDNIDFTDGRFTITHEYDGHPKARFIIRFCDKFISSHETIYAAKWARNELIIERHNKLTRGELT